MSQAFLHADRDQLYALYKLVTLRQIAPDELDYITEWIDTDEWAADARDMITWLNKLPEREPVSLQEVVEIEVIYERSQRPRKATHPKAA